MKEMEDQVEKKRERGGERERVRSKGGKEGMEREN